jgi:hypothetical protein
MVFPACSGEHFEVAFPACAAEESVAGEVCEGIVVEVEVAGLQSFDVCAVDVDVLSDQRPEVGVLDYTACAVLPEETVGLVSLACSVCTRQFEYRWDHKR